MRVLVLVLALLLVAACTSDPAPTPPPPTRTQRPTPAPHPPVPRAKDRDVLATLAGLDLCALVKGENVTLWGPHRCTLATPASDAIQVSFGERTDRIERFARPVEVVAGAKVDAIDEKHGHCSMELPVSFTYAVVFFSDTCAGMDDVIATVVARLAAPGKVRHRADQPDMSKDACAVLAGALTDAAHPTPELHRVNLDVCSGDVPHLGKTTLEQYLQRAPPDGQFWTKWAVVAGKQVYKNSRGCRWEWSEGGYADGRDRTVILGIDCAPELPDDQAKKLLSAIMTRLGTAQSPVKATKLTYAPGEPDEPNPGACVDFQPDACEPFQPTPVPAGARPATVMAQADSHVLCAAAVDAVRGQFPQARPVVDTQQLACVFVQPDHAVELTVDVLTSNDSGYRPTTVRKLTVAGRSAEYREYADRAMASLCVDSGVPSQYGTGTLLWCVTATFRAPRNTPTAEPDLRAAARLEPLLAGLVAKYLA